MCKTLYIIAGANGSGKSTLANELPSEYNLIFLNADDIAKKICPQDIKSVKIQAGKIFLKKLDELLINDDCLFNNFKKGLE